MASIRSVESRYSCFTLFISPNNLKCTLDSIFTSKLSNLTWIHQFYDPTTIRLRHYSFGNRLKDKIRIGTPICQSFQSKQQVTYSQILGLNQMLPKTILASPLSIEANRKQFNRVIHIYKQLTKLEGTAKLHKYLIFLSQAQQTKHSLAINKNSLSF